MHFHEASDKIQRMLDAINPPGLKAIAAVQSIMATPFDAIAKMDAAFKVASVMDTISHHAAVTKYMDTFRHLDSIQAVVKATAAIDYNSIARLPVIFHKFFDEGLEDEEPPTDDTPSPAKVYLNKVAELKGLIHEIYRDNSQLLKVSSRKFEEIIAELLRNQGFDVKLTKATRDGGYDIRAIHSIVGHAPMLFLVECKRYRPNRPIGIDIVRSFKEVLLCEGASRGIIAATSYFTQDARKKQKETPYLLDYRDKDDIMKWVAEYAQPSASGLILPHQS